MLLKLCWPPPCHGPPFLLLLNMLLALRTCVAIGRRWVMPVAFDCYRSLDSSTAPAQRTLGCMIAIWKTFNGCAAAPYITPSLTRPSATNS
uniref:Secreted protein n=1 Tax=Anopheles darlingi TaxID=43151 RepID=A0A2M4DGZ9_ANODA